MQDPLNDAGIVALMAAGDRHGLEAAYDAYADRLHDYARGMLRTADPDAAADVTHDTFLIAFAKAGDLRNPERLRPWLYAITRNECLRVLRTTKRTDPLDDHDLAEGSTDMSQNIAATDLKELVHAAAAGLAPKDREVFELSLRHDLAGAEIAAALGVSDNAAHAMMSRVRAQLERALGAFVVARDRSCPSLDAVLAGWDGTFDPLWRKRIARHVESCDTCTGVQKRELSPAALLAVAPLAAAPVMVRTRLVSAEIDPDRLAALVDSAGPWLPDGFPGAVPPRRRRGLLAAAAVLLLILGGTAATRLLTREGDAVLEAGPISTTSAPGTPATFAPTPTLTARPTPTPTPTPTPSATVTPSPTFTPTPTPTPKPTRTPRPTPKPTRTPKPTPSPTATPPPPVTGTLSVSPLVETCAPLAATCRVTLTATGASVGWTVTHSPALIAWSAESGTVAVGAPQTVTFVVARGTAPGTSLTATFGPGGIAVTVVVI